MAEPLGIVSLVLQAITSIDKVATLFSRVQNAPKEVRLLKILLSGIAHDFEHLNSEATNNGLLNIPPEAVEEIKEQLRECRAYLDNYYAIFSSTGAFGSVRRVFWSGTRSMDLDRHRANIQVMYTVFILPRLSTARAHCAHCPSNAVQHPQISAPPPPSRRSNHNASFSSTLVAQFSDHISELAIAPDGSAQSVRGTVVDEISAIEADATNLDASFTKLKVVLQLGSKVPVGHRSLNIEGVQVMDQGERFTILRFRCNGGSIRIKHLVPSDAIPFTTGKDSQEVTFLTVHTMTVIDDDGHHVYQIDRPVYRFSELQGRRTFQEFSRGRQLLGEFEASDITDFKGSARTCLSRCQVIQIWSSQESRCFEPTVTMAFLVTTEKQGQPHFYHAEWRVNDFDPQVALIKGPKSRKLKTAVLQRRSLTQSSTGSRQGLSITLEDEVEAESFTRMLETHIDPAGLLPAFSFQSKSSSTTLSSGRSIYNLFLK
ncbi:hypothetical protein QBC35DRAFT_508327 [Podospora australis]|uniref:Uncharacterized protein n=1 Tax=Podospora australis TaxID=1536484 RepID=A0AAN6WKG4_9PEZI|nr:hypothetical protein QBC35DRAFT_508327 [Podospora australis]